MKETTLSTSVETTGLSTSVETTGETLAGDEYVPKQQSEKLQRSPGCERPQTLNDGDGIIRNADFDEAFNLLEFSSESVFITGQAGSGKSTLLRFLRENTKKNVVVLAPTGLAAVNIGGQTIHSFFRFAP